MTLIHIHESTDIHGGAEVYIHQLQTYLQKEGITSYWMSITKTNNTFRIKEFGSASEAQIEAADIFVYLTNLIHERAVDIINIHSFFETEIVKHLLSLRPVVKFSHSPIMVCPGRDKFWRHSERICEIPYGLHCFYHIYKEGCANRHPKRIAKAWRSVSFETKVASRKYKKIVVMSDYIKHGLIECGVPANKIVLNPYFTDTVDAQELATTSAEKRILFSGRVISSKGPHILMQSLGDILRTRNDVYLDIAGDGLMLKDLKRMAIKSGLEDKVVFHGWQDRASLKNLLRKSHIVAVPSLYPEAFGIVGIEAMMHGKPVVGFDAGGISTWLEDSKTGFLVPRGNAFAFSEKIALLLENQGLYRTMSEHARRVALERYDYHIHLTKLLEVYEYAASAKKEIL